MKRKIYNELLKWKALKKDKMPLVLYGARQVGKTYIVTEFGKNNYQNEELTFKFASGNDWWFHAKGIAGSHVIVKCNGEEPPIQTFEEAAALAAYFSKGRGSDKLEIDYTIKKNVKKPNGSKPGFVVYYTNYSMMASGSIHNIELVSKEDEIFLERR